MPVVQLDERRPHVVIEGMEAIHVVPTSVFYDVVDGKINVSDIESSDDIMRSIIQEWLYFINN